MHKWSKTQKSTLLIAKDPFCFPFVHGRKIHLFIKVVNIR